MRLLPLLLAALVVLLVVRWLGAAARLGDGTRGGPWDPYAVLGVGREASAAEITRAYREQLKQYHPDRVATLGPDLQRLAHQRTIEIQRAYTELSRA